MARHVTKVGLHRAGGQRPLERAELQLPAGCEEWLFAGFHSLT